MQLAHWYRRHPLVEVPAWGLPKAQVASSHLMPQPRLAEHRLQQKGRSEND